MMKSKAPAVQPILEMTKNRAKACQVSAQPPSSHARYRALCGLLLLLIVAAACGGGSGGGGKLTAPGGGPVFT
jgi:hypothetical protein